MLRTMSDLKEEFPENKYLLMERFEDMSKLFGSYVDGNFEICIMSPNSKGALQPVLYRDLNAKVVVCPLCKQRLSNYNELNGTKYALCKRCGVAITIEELDEEELEELKTKKQTRYKNER